MRLKIILLIILAAGITACAARTSVSGKWTDDASRETRFKRILVVTLARETTRRQQFDSELSLRLTRNDTVALAASSMIKIGDVITRDAVEKMVVDNAIDGVVISRVTQRRVIPKEITSKTDSKVYRNTGQPYGGFDNNDTFDFVQYDYKPEINTKDYTIAEYDLTFVTEVYETSDGKVLYTIDSSATNQSDISSMINELAKKIAADIRRAGLAQ